MRCITNTRAFILNARGMIASLQRMWQRHHVWIILILVLTLTYSAYVVYRHGWCRLRIAAVFPQCFEARREYRMQRRHRMRQRMRNMLASPKE